MSDDRHLQLIFDYALRLHNGGHVDNAIDQLTRLLGEDPDHADAHALLSLCLVRRKRLHAAQLEAARALELDPESVFGHLAIAGVLIARRRFAQAEEHLLQSLSMHPDNTEAMRMATRLYRLWRRPDKAMVQIERACALQPDDADNWALYALLKLDRGDRAQADTAARRALELDPEHVDALVVLGHCALAEGRPNAAREHALWALQLEPDDPDAHTLMAGVKARESLLLGLWWRFQSFITSGSNRRAIALLVCAYLLYRAVGIALEAEGLTRWSPYLDGIWFGFCAYTWFAPALFRRSIERELETVRLRPDY
jgi:tetratricopeptide (TPR) repeat protein